MDEIGRTSRGLQSPGAVSDKNALAGRLANRGIAIFAILLEGATARDLLQLAGLPKVPDSTPFKHEDELQTNRVNAIDGTVSAKNRFDHCLPRLLAFHHNYRV